jgi:hypothetical protein
MFCHLRQHVLLASMLLVLAGCNERETARDARHEPPTDQHPKRAIRIEEVIAALEPAPTPDSSEGIVMTEHRSNSTAPPRIPATMYTAKAPDLGFGEVLDKTAELNDRLFSAPLAPTTAPTRPGSPR